MNSFKIKTNHVDLAVIDSVYQDATLEKINNVPSAINYFVMVYDKTHKCKLNMRIIATAMIESLTHRPLNYTLRKYFVSTTV